MAEFLTELELEDLTGLKQYSAQARWLKKERIRFRRRADGVLRVLWSDVKARPGEHPTPAGAQPNFAALPALR